MDGGYNYDAGRDVDEFMERETDDNTGRDFEELMEFMRGDNYDAVSDVKGIFPEEFRKYVCDQNLICNDLDGIWVFRNKHQSEADRDIVEQFAILLDAFSLDPEELCLVQFWRQLTSIDDFGERHFHLTTRNQPFVLTGRYDGKIWEGICSYRMKMVDIITGDGRGAGGVIGRVFRDKRMEYTPNIGYYSKGEHSYRDLALSCHIKLSLTIPLSNSSGRSVGVLEIVSSVELNLLTLDCCLDILNSVGYLDCCKDIREQYDSEDDSLQMAVSEIKKIMQLVGRSCCLVFAQTWMMCNSCSYLHTSERLDYDLSAFYKGESFEPKELSDDEYFFTLKKGEGVVGKAAASSHDLVYCDDVSQLGITEYPLAHFARHHKLTACFATCLRSNHTGNQIYVLEFFLKPSKVNGRDRRAMLVPILEGLRKYFRTFKFASGEEIGNYISVQVIDVRFPDKFEILEIGRLDSIENSMEELGGSAPSVQSESFVTIKAKYGDNFIKFKLSSSSGINEFHHQVSKRLKLEAETYVIKYQDDDKDWILVVCDDDLQDYISNSASLGKTTLTMLLEKIK